jgi:hypothetical protein
MMRDLLPEQVLMKCPQCGAREQRPTIGRALWRETLVDAAIFRALGQMLIERPRLLRDDRIPASGALRRPFI